MKKKNKIWIYPFMILGVFLMLVNSCTKVEDTNNPATGGTVTDIDGNVYKTVTIGTQVWMAENLKTTKYRNGDPIPNITDTLAWGSQTEGAYCWYGNLSANKKTYGALYNWYTVSDIRHLEPLGWHVPTQLEWETLFTHLGGVTVAGGKLKEAGITHWTTPNGGSTNSSGFTALPGGYQESIGWSTSGILDYGDWWSSTVGATGGAWNFELNNSDDTVRTLFFSKTGGSSVRCIKD